MASIGKDGKGVVITTTDSDVKSRSSILPPCTGTGPLPFSGLKSSYSVGASDDDMTQLWTYIQNDKRFASRIREWGRYFDASQQDQKGSKYRTAKSPVDNVRDVFARLAERVVPKHVPEDEFVPSTLNGERFLPVWFAQKYDGHLEWERKPESWTEMTEHADL